MKTGPTSVPLNLASDALFRQWAQTVHDALVALGLVQTADTGQINLTTVTRPAAGVSAGYEIWRFDDALQATYPIIFKLEYTTGGDGTYSGLAITVGPSTNGAGTITGTPTITRKTFGQATSAAAGTSGIAYSGGDMADGRIWLLASGTPDNYSYSSFFSLERTRGEDGVPTGDGYSLFYQSSSTSNFQLVPFLGAQPGQKSYLPTIDPGYYGRAVNGNDVAVCPCFFFIGTPFYLANLVCIYSNSVPAQTEFVLNHLAGVDHTFMSLYGVLYQSTSQGAGYIAARYED